VTAPQRTTPNPATVERPERSSRRVSRKAPLGWLPWALLAALAALLLLTFLIVNAIDDDGPEGSAGDSLGQVSGDDGESPVGTDGESGQGGGSGSGTGSGSGAGGDAIAGLSQSAVVGGGAVQPGPAGRVAGAEALTSQPGTAGAVLFAEGSAEIDQAGQQVIATTVTNLRDAGVTSVEVVGHTDVVAGDPVNDTLSQERADAVAQALQAELPDLQVTTAARGQDEPIADNESEEGRQLNRRAVITATG
jgi:outer membrane protein OmpA-like peptidoglycan-associated protein